jgi:hypothetical protein
VVNFTFHGGKWRVVITLGLQCIFHVKCNLLPYMHLGASGGVVVKGTALVVGGSRDRSPVVSLGILSESTDGTMCSGVDSASKNEYQELSGGEGSRCVRVTTLPPSCAECREDPGALTSWNPRSLPRLVAGYLYLYVLSYMHLNREKNTVYPHSSAVIHLRHNYYFTWWKNPDNFAFKIIRNRNVKLV